MNKDVYGILGDLTAEILLEIIAECMDDYLYVIDLQNNKMEISQSALDRFMISETHGDHVRCLQRRPHYVCKAYAGCDGWKGKGA